MNNCPKCGRKKISVKVGAWDTIYCTCSSCDFVWTEAEGKGMQSYLTEIGYRDVPLGCLPIFREQRHG